MCPFLLSAAVTVSYSESASIIRLLAYSIKQTRTQLCEKL